MQELKTLKAQILYCLEYYPDTRNSDFELTKRVWRNYYDKFLTLGLNASWYVNIDKLKWLPSQDAIKRLRAKIQNQQMLFLPTDEKVAEARRWRSEVWSEFVQK